jgi:KUP system potassium uptake protein
MPDWFQPIGIVIALLLLIVFTSISGSLHWSMRQCDWILAKVKIKYPIKGQLYIPSINWLLFLAVLELYYTEESSNMEHAYGLAIILCMIMTTILLNFYLIMKE